MRDNLLDPARPCTAARELGHRIAATLAVLEDDELNVIQRNRTARLLLTEALRLAEPRRVPA